MLPAIATAWIPAAVGVGVPALTLLVIWLGRVVSRRGGSDEADDSDGGGGAKVRLPPRRPPPAGPVSWPEFERDFADYVAAHPGGRAPAPTGAGRDGPRRTATWRRSPRA